MYNPHELPAPPMEQPVQRVRAYAADLAYGALVGLWNAELSHGIAGASPLGILTRTKWSQNQPHNDLLTAFGYLRNETVPSNRYILTQKAFDLLETIPPQTRIFISYGRRQSSTLGLAIQYKLLSLGVDAFLDRDLDPGVVWHARLEEKVKQSDYFICLLAPKNATGAATLASPYVEAEVRWASETKRPCIPFWHPHFKFVKKDAPNSEDLFNEYLNGKNAIRVHEESAEGYHDAISKLLNELGHSGL